jgi:hypothetical protein
MTVINPGGNPGGLLWFDDDTRRTIQEKIAEAAQRYRERVGYEPTVCQLNPAQATALESGADRASARAKRTQAAAKPAPPVSLRLVPNDYIQPNCYLLGVGEGEEPRRAALPYQIEPEDERARNARPAQASRVYRASRAPAARTAAAKPGATIPAVKPAAQPIAAKPVAAKPVEATPVAKPVAAKPTADTRGVKAAFAASKVAEPDARTSATAAKRPAGKKASVVATGAAKPSVDAIAKRLAKPVRRRTPSIEQPMLIAIAPEPATLPRKRTTRPTASAEMAGRAPAKLAIAAPNAPAAKTAPPDKTAKKVAAAPVPALIVPARSTKTVTSRSTTVQDKSGARRSVKRGTSAAVVQPPMLPLVAETPAPRTRRTRSHVA